jgi:D-sedoheptulose 7-phosphate isomerase
VLLTLSASGESANVLTAAQAAREVGMDTWALTGAAPNRLAASCAEVVSVDSACCSTVQEVHLVALHLLCRALDRQVAGELRKLDSLEEALR